MDAAKSSRAIVDAARALSPQIERDTGQIDRERRLTPALIAALQGAGLFRMLVPRSMGGGELPLAIYAEVIEEIARADASTAWCLAQNGGICRVAAYMPRQGAKEIFGRPDMTLAWGNGPATAVEVKGGFRLSGRWSFASGIHHATWIGCQECPLVDENGEARLDEQGEPRRRTLLFPQAAAAIEDVWQVSGLRGTGSDSYSVADLFVPAEHSAGHQALEPGPLYVFGTTNIFAIGFAAVALGLARGSLDAFRELITTKTPRGISGVLREQQTTQVLLGQTEAVLRSARAFLFETVADAWQSVSDKGALDLETRILIRLAATNAMRRAADVVDSVFYAAGATAIFDSNAFERRFRDMHAATQHLQAREDHYEAVGRYFAGLEPDHHWL